MAALSRALGGYHIPIDNNVGLRVDRDISVWSWSIYQEYSNGAAKVRPDVPAPSSANREPIQNE